MTVSRHLLALLPLFLSAVVINISAGFPYTETQREQKRSKEVSSVRDACERGKVLGLGTYMEKDLGAYDSPKCLNNKRTVSQCPAQSGPATCNRQEHLCWGMHHPQCTVVYEASSSTESSSSCRLKVRCNYSSEFFSSGGACYAATRPFPKPQKPGVNSSTLQYSFIVEFYGTNGSRIARYSLSGNRATAKSTVFQKIREHTTNQTFDAIRIVTDYTCNILTPCTETD